MLRQLDHSIVNDEHRKIFSILALQLDMDEGEVENYSLSSTKVKSYLSYNLKIQSSILRLTENMKLRYLRFKEVQTLFSNKII